VSSAVLPDGYLAVPVIDITSFRMPYPDAAARARAVRQVDLAARTVGFMHITGHGIPPATLNAFTSATDAFFALDMETKQGYRCRPGANWGYTSSAHTSPPGMFEAINVGPSGTDFPEVPWFEDAVTTWFEAEGRVARTMVRIFGVALGGREDYFADVTDHSIDVLRMNNYRLPKPDATLAPDQLGLDAHTDFGIVTVLWADRVPGLEIHGVDGRWHPVMPAHGALLVNLGDAIARWTNEEWISTLHRVAAPRIDGALVPRRSAAYFHDGNLDALVECLPTNPSVRTMP
jgi:isopenicillin N synthase-like dioxygenase